MYMKMHRKWTRRKDSKLLTVTTTGKELVGDKRG